MIYTKLKAQKILIGKSSKTFFVSVMPIFMTFTLLYLNYYLLLYLKNNTDINLFVKISVGFLIFAVSMFLINAVAFLREIYFYKIATDSFVSLRHNDIFCFFGVFVLKTLLFFSLSAVFFSPSVILLYCAYLSKLGGYSDKVTVTLVISAATVVLVGAGCLFVIWGRYAKSTYAQLKYSETNPVRALAKSIELMEGEQLRYALFRLSFLGWNILSMLIFPIAYVLPYKKCSKYIFFNEKKVQKTEYTSEKPIVFIFG